ncbi:hypothetical protein OF846_002310 [Rhodotorula toruloides]|nr:hypothetical protein OF846_002310 [Rhodotorula toruloides]
MGTLGRGDACACGCEASDLACGLDQPGVHRGLAESSSAPRVDSALCSPAHPGCIPRPPAIVHVVGALADNAWTRCKYSAQIVLALRPYARRREAKEGRSFSRSLEEEDARSPPSPVGLDGCSLSFQRRSLPREPQPGRSTGGGPSPGGNLTLFPRPPAAVSARSHFRASQVARFDYPPVFHEFRRRLLACVSSRRPTRRTLRPSLFPSLALPIPTLVKGAMLASLFSSPTVKVTLSEDEVFVHPVDADYPTQDPVLRGTTLLSLPSRKAVKRIKVVLEGLCDVQAGAGNPYETTLVLRKELETDLGGECISEGHHAFNFAFIIPSTTPASQRCIYGRIRYYVKATVEFDGVLSPSVCSPSVAFWVCGNPSPPGELPSTTDLSFQHFSEDLGPVGIGVSSPHLTVAALVNIRLSLLGPVKPVTIISVNGIITQTFEVTYADGRVARPKPKAHVLTKVDQKASPSLVVPIHNPATCTEEPGQLDEGAIPAQTNPCVPAPSFRPVSKCCAIHPDVPVPDPSPLVHLEAGQEFHHARICRVPTDDHVRPSTLDGSRGTRIRVSHVLSVEVRYKKDGSDEEMVLTMGKPVTITSCCCLVDSLFLPAYSADRATPTITEPIKNHCLCNLTTKSLLDRDGEQLRRAGAIEKPVTERSLGIAREDKSPAWTSGLGEYASACVVRQDSGYQESGDVIVEA